MTCIYSSVGICSRRGLGTYGECQPSYVWEDSRVSKYHKYLLLTIALIIGASVVVAKVKMREGLDLAGGMRVVLQANPDDLKDAKGQILSPEAKADKMNAVIRTIRTRVEGNFGVAEPQISRQGDDRVLVELPGLKNKQQALDQIKDTAKLEIYYLKDVRSDRNPSAPWLMLEPQADEKTGMDVYAFENTVSKEIVKSNTPEGMQKILDEVIDAKSKTNPDGQSPIVTGDDLKPNAVGDFENGSQAVIRFELNNKGAENFREFTQRHIGEATAILIGNTIVTAPRVQSVIPDGKGQITGFSNLEDAQQKAQLLNSGALPVQLTIVQLDDVEATLGKDTVKQAKLAGLIGFALVMIFMLVVYRLPGLLADVALVIYALLTWAAFTALGVTMTLAGLAAFVLSIGMAVDANVLIFERLKEELRSGKTLHAAIDAGFSRAFTAIFDSNMCTIITALILMKIGTGTVQSFAFTLVIGVLVSMFTAILVTRSFLHLVVSLPWAQNPNMFGLGASWFTRSGLNVVGRRNAYFALSAIVIIPGLIFYGLNFVKTGHGLKPGIEFKPGTTIEMTFESARMEAKFAKPIDIPQAQLENLVTSADPNSSEITNKVEVAGDTATITAALGKNDQAQIDSIKKALSTKLTGNSLTDFNVELNTPRDIRAGEVSDVIEGLGVKNTAQISQGAGKPITAFIRTDQLKSIDVDRDKIVDALEAKYGMAKVSSSSVGATISKELTQKAIFAVILAAIAIVLYLTIRFAVGGFADGLKYGICAIAATLHDVLVITGLFAAAGYLWGWEIDTLFVTAVLTMIGFSTHDTIVVFDRIRENLKHRVRGEDFETLANKSILQTFTRSINTSVTVLLTIVALTVFGGGGLSIKHLYIALLVGIISGTYSSIFNATPLLVVWENIANRRKGGTTAQRRVAEDKALVTASEVKVSAPAPSNGGGGVDVDDDKTKVKPKRKKRRF